MKAISVPNGGANRPPILIVPGLRDEMPGHWQSLLAARTPNVRSVPAMGRANLSCSARIIAIDAAIAAMAQAPIVVAHSGGVLAFVHWAARFVRPIAGALLAVPPDFERPMPEGYPAIADLQAHGWLPVPRDTLPFPTIVALSQDDPLAEPTRVRELANAWGSHVHELGNAGHLNPASGYGEWAGADLLIDAIAQRAAVAEATA